MMLSFILILSGISSAALAAWTYSCRKKFYGTTEFSLFLLSVSIFSLGYALEINQKTLEGMYDSLKIQFIGIPFTAVFFLLFSVKIATKRKINNYLYSLLFIIPVITVALVFTVEKHNFFYISSSVDTTGIFPLLDYKAGPWYKINMISLISAASAAETILLIKLFRTDGLRRKQIAFVFIAGLVSLLPAVVNPSRVHNFDIQPFCLTMSGSILSVAVFRYRMFSLVPYAREIAVDSITEYLIVFDDRGYVQDINASAGKSEMLKDCITGSFLPDKSPLKRFADLLLQYKGNCPSNLDYSFEYKEKNYLLKTSCIRNKNTAESGFVFIISDITKSVKRIKDLEYHAIYDSLTGIFNRRYIIDLLVQETKVVEKGRGPIGLVLMDLDYFKSINDNYGHHAGDLVLKEVTAAVSKELRVSDLFGRYGGEEFLIICPSSDSETTLSIAERLRKALENLEIVYENNRIKITASLGVYSDHFSEKENIDEMLRKVDIALYSAKNNGRNRAEQFPDSGI